MNARWRRGEQIIYEDRGIKKYERDDRALGYTSIDLVRVRDEAIDSGGNRLPRQEATNPFKQGVTKSKLQ